MKGIILGRTQSRISALSIIDLLFDKFEAILAQKSLLEKVPMTSIEDMQQVAHCLINLDMHPYQRHPSEIQQHDEQPCIRQSFGIKKASQQIQNSLLLNHRNISLTIPKRESSNHSRLASSTTKRRKGQQIIREEGHDFSKFSVEIDLGFTPPTDPNEDMIRKKKEEEINRKMEREQADLKKIMNRKKMDKEMMDALIKDKKQVVFTYDYDGLLLPVTKLEPSKLPVSHCEMSYVIDSGEHTVLKPQQNYHQPTIIKKGKKKFNKNRTANLHDPRTEMKQNQCEASEFYRNFETTELAPGATLKFKGTQLSSEIPIPNVEFLNYKTKQPQRIQLKHYLQYIKNGNLKRFELQAEQKSNRLKQSQCVSQLENSSRLSSIFKRSRKFHSGQSIVISNTQLMKDLKNFRMTQSSATNDSFCNNFHNDQKNTKKLSKFSYINPIDEFNLSTLTHKKQSNQTSDTFNKKTPIQSKKIPFGSIHQRSSTASKIRVRKSFQTILQN